MPDKPYRVLVQPTARSNCGQCGGSGLVRTWIQGAVLQQAITTYCACVMGVFPKRPRKKKRAKRGK